MVHFSSSEYIFANACHEKLLGKPLSGVRGSTKPVSCILTVLAELDHTDSMHMWISKYLESKETQQVVQFQTSYQPQEESVMHLHVYIAHIDSDMFAYVFCVSISLYKVSLSGHY